jgi:hypothetical protein
MVHMPEYKRNQVEEAISAVLEPKSSEPTAELRTRIKRLLETDRAVGRTLRSNDPERDNYAFYSAEAPGSGVEVMFSDYEAFAVLTGLFILMHGSHQSFAVSVLRRVRRQLEREYARILKQNPDELFDQEAIRRNAKAGDMVFNNTDPVLLTIVSKAGVAPAEQKGPHACAVCRGPIEAQKFIWEASGGLGGSTMFELVGAAHGLARALAQTEPRHRGRN